MKVEVSRQEGGRLPVYKTPNSAGADLCSIVDEMIQPGEVVLINTGIRVSIPKGYELQVRSRSGLAFKEHIFVLNAPGTVDSDYRGLVGVILANFGKQPFHVKRGDRIAQAVVSKVEHVEWESVEQVDMDTERGEGGFGSTGVK